MLVMLNDNTADGHDVSWIWDADVEPLRGRVASVVFAGSRAGDMALRFKYAEVAGNGSDPIWRLAEDTRELLLLLAWARVRLAPGDRA